MLMYKIVVLLTFVALLIYNICMISFMDLIIIFVIVLVSMVLHEMAHAYVAYALGDTTAKDEGRLSPNPMVHIDPIMSVLVPMLLFISGGPVFGGAKPVPIDSRNLKWGPWGMALVAFAGPLMNFILAFVGFMIGHFTGWFYGSGGEIMYSISTNFLYANLGFFAFNLIPIPPLDGSRILYAIAPDGVRDVMEQIERSFGIILVFVLVMVFGSSLSAFTREIMTNIVKFFFMLVGVS